MKKTKVANTKCLSNDWRPNSCWEQNIDSQEIFKIETKLAVQKKEMIQHYPKRREEEEEEEEIKQLDIPEIMK